MKEGEIKKLLEELFDIKYNWTSGSSSYNSSGINKEAKDKVEVVIRQFLLDNRDSELGELRAKCYAYEKIIANSNFAPMIKRKTNNCYLPETDNTTTPPKER